MATITFQTYDRSNKRSSMAIGADDAVTDPQVQAVADALNAVIVGTDVKATVTIPNVVDAGVAGPSASIQAQRGNKWLPRFQSSAGADIGKVFTHEIGTCDNTVLPSATDDFLDLTAGVGLALKTAADVAWRSPIGSAGALVSVQQVNRGEN